jgi:hypothetical protein
MEPTTIRLPATTLADLDSEYADYGYSSRSDYIRAIIEARDPPPATTEATGDYGRPTTADYERLRDRVAELEDRVADLDPAADMAGSATVVSPDEPQGSDVETAVVEYVCEHGPVQRSAIIDAFEPRWQSEGIQGDSWWTRRARPALNENGAEYQRNEGWSVEKS